LNKIALAPVTCFAVRLQFSLRKPTVIILRSLFLSGIVSRDYLQQQQHKKDKNFPGALLY